MELSSWVVCFLAVLIIAMAVPLVFGWIPIGTIAGPLLGMALILPSAGLLWAVWEYEK